MQNENHQFERVPEEKCEHEAVDADNSTSPFSHV